MSEKDYEKNAPARWRATAENAIGCQKGLELGSRNCRKCENLEYCLNYHEETLAAICTWIADLIEESGGFMTKSLSNSLKKEADKVFHGEQKEIKKRDVEENFYM